MKGFYQLNGTVGMEGEIIIVAKCGHRHPTLEAAQKCLLRRINIKKGSSLKLIKDSWKEIRRE
jgi:hypothetical protein